MEPEQEIITPPTHNPETETNSLANFDATSNNLVVASFTHVPLPPDRNPAAVYLATLRPTGRRSQRQALNAIAAILSSGKLDAFTFPWHSLRYQHTAALRANLQERNPATANKFLSALKRTLLEAKRLKLMSAEDYSEAVDVKGIRGESMPRGHALKGAELKALVAVCRKDHSPAGARDAALIVTLYGAGLRRSEVVTLDLKDLQLDTGEIKVRKGKGSKDRICYLPGGAVDAVIGWLRVRGDWSGPLFCPINKGGNIQQRRLNSQGVFEAIRKRAKESGVESFSPHDLRRTFVSDLLDAGADIVTVQKLAGHASVTTTARYDRRGETAKQKAVGLLQIPYEE